MSNVPIAPFKKLVLRVCFIAAAMAPAYAAFAAPTSHRSRRDLECHYIGTGYCCLCWYDYPYRWCESGAILGVYHCDAVSGDCGYFTCQVQ